MNWEDKSLIRKPKKLKLYKALKLSYITDDNKRAKVLKRYGFILDKELSNKEHYVAYNPFDKKLLYAPRGTELRHGGHVFDNKDLQTDLLLGTGALKQTKRYDDEKDTILKARKKYNEDEVVMIGHSLAGGIINVLPSEKKDKIITYNAPILKPRKDAVHYRTEGDIFSKFNPETTTLKNENLASNIGSYLLKAHELNNLKNENIFV